MEPTLRHHVIFQVSSARWDVLIANYNDKYYSHLATCDSLEDAEYICEALNEKWYAVGQS